MPRLWRLAIANWWASPGRTLPIVVSVGLGVGTVVMVTGFYETARRAIASEVVQHWLGSAHLTIHPPGAHWGTLDATLADKLLQLDNVRFVTARLRRRLRMIPAGNAKLPSGKPAAWVDAVGIDPRTELSFRTLPGLTGRMLRPAESGVAVLERDAARAWGLRVGAEIMLAVPRVDAQMSFHIVGLFDSQRVADFQAPTVFVPISDLQRLKMEQGMASVIDVMLADASPDTIDAAKRAVEQCIRDQSLPYPYRVETAAARQMLLAEAERVTRLILMLIAFVAMLTAFFIILTTQGVSLIQRRPQLGIMRCVGMTRGQLASLLFAELTPLGIVGTAVGLAGGVVAARLVAFLAADIVTKFYISPWGVGLAVVSGLITTLVSTLFIMFQTGRVVPLDAVNQQARPARLWLAYAVSAAGVGLLVLHHLMVITPDRTRWLQPLFAAAGAGTLYVGYALIAPALVVCLGRPMAGVVGRLLGLRAKLAQAPFTRAPWRTTGACWVLMVGLSLIVYLAVRAEGILAIWDFPARLPATFVWSPEYVSGRVIERVRRLPGVARSTTSTDVDCEIEKAGAKKPSFADSVVDRFLRRLTRPVFVAGEADELFSIMKVAFVEGAKKPALEKLRRGGYVLIPPQTARNHDLSVGDRVTVTIGRRSAEFEVAGVIQSPALDLAVTAFQAESYMQFASASAILGTRADLKDKFGLDVVSMFMCDIDLPPSPPPPDFNPLDLPDADDEPAVASAAWRWASYMPNEREGIDAAEPKLDPETGGRSVDLLPSETKEVLHRFARALRHLERDPRTEERSVEENWVEFRERVMLYRIADEMGRPDAIMGSLRRLKQEVDTSLKRALMVLTWLPSIVIVVAAIGIGNLMMVSVHVRARQIAVLRAVGALKTQIIRLILSEAVTLGLLGSVIGVALGLHEAYSINQIAVRLIDVNLEFIVPFGVIAMSVVLTVAVCLLAGIAPARYAARNNIIEAMQAT